MKKEIALNTQNIKFTLKRNARSRSVKLAVYHDGACVVTAPHAVSESRILRFITSKSEWILDAIKRFSTIPRSLSIRSSKRDFARYKNEAFALVNARLQHFNTIYNFAWNNIAIKNQKTRWGSCSQKKNLNFSYRIAQLPERLADYIIVHELCHLSELNHSRDFWKLVQKAIPDYKEIKREFKKYS